MNEQTPEFKYVRAITAADAALRHACDSTGMRGPLGRVNITRTASVASNGFYAVVLRAESTDANSLPEGMEIHVPVEVLKRAAPYLRKRDCKGAYVARTDAGKNGSYRAKLSILMPGAPDETWTIPGFERAYPDVSRVLCPSDHVGYPAPSHALNGTYLAEIASIAREVSGAKTVRLGIFGTDPAGRGQVVITGPGGFLAVLMPMTDDKEDAVAIARARVRHAKEALGKPEVAPIEPEDATEGESAAPSPAPAAADETSPAETAARTEPTPTARPKSAKKPRASAPAPSPEPPASCPPPPAPVADGVTLSRWAM